MKKTLAMLCSAIFMLCIIQGEVNAQQNALSPVSPATPATPATPNGPGEPATPATPATPAVQVIGGSFNHDEEKVLLKEAVTDRLVMPGQGSSIANPIMPNSSVQLESGGITYTIYVEVTGTTVTIWIDPVIAVGFNYAVEKGPKITAVELPKGIGDNMFDLWFYESGKYVDSGFDIEGGALYKFNEPVSNFSIRGIETSAELDPANETAFPTGLRYEKTGKSVVSMTSVVQEI
ncbi:MAG: hypothetical protein D3925_14040 [Candidatus Electrothrix sp. AR5]|nr:hypothetical protein [Candidatus Electrothrix sp. AR5]